jgi:RsiW-degrading membrane proteinase PrsW (M82 family)
MASFGRCLAWGRRLVECDHMSAARHRHTPISGVPIAISALAVTLAALVWNAVFNMARPIVSHSLYIVPPALALVGGLLVAAAVSRMRHRWTAAIAAVIAGLIVGVIAGVVALLAVSSVVGTAAMQGDDAFAANEGVVALIVAPLECLFIALLGVRLAGPRRLDPTVPSTVSTPGAPLLTDPTTPLMPHVSAQRHRHYRVVLIAGLLLFAVLTGLTAETGSVIAVAAVLVVGSFFVPVVYVEYIQEIDAFGGVPHGALVRTGFLTALFGIPSAGVLEAIEHAGAGSLLPALLTGFTEEGVKILLVVLLLRRTRYRFELDGVIFGAAAGMGFAAFENAGYAITALSQHGIPDFLSTLWLRQALGPFGHGTWTAAIAAVVWRQRYGGPRAASAGILGAYVVSSVLHAAWDWNPLGGLGGFFWLLAVGAISIAVLRGRVRESIRQERLFAASPQFSAS